VRLVSHAMTENAVPLARFASDRVIREGDVVLRRVLQWDVRGVHRPVECGRSKMRLRRIYRALIDVLNSVTDAMTSAWADGNFRTLRDPAVSDREFTLQRGMVFSVEPCTCPAYPTAAESGSRMKC
jgi:hypothetical protein